MAENVSFTPLENFRDADLRSEYLVGFNYTIRPGNEKLAAKVAGWVKEGKVRLGTADGAISAEARVRGSGTVQ